MELKHLETFVTVARRHSFTRAAQSLEITQAAVSQHIAALESELGVPLFDRGGRQVGLTAAGEKLHDYAGQIFALVDEAKRSVGSAAAEPIRGTLRIASSTVPMETLLPQILADFRQRFPDVREEIHVTDSRDAAQAVERDEADVGFVGQPPASAKLARRALGSDALVLCLPGDHELAGKTTISLGKLKQLPLIVREFGSGSRACLEEALAEKDLTLAELNVVIEVNSNEAIREAVLHGSGAAFLSQNMIARDVAQGRLVPIKVRSLRPRRQLYVTYFERAAQREPLRSFLAFLEEDER